jgi:catechol 2,3-dioxygenase-like lactoylglutathione lyase family enzyme
MAGAIDATLRKFHASLNVSDLERSIGFYRALLGAEPAKVRSDYAKFDLADPQMFGHVVLRDADQPRDVADVECGVHQQANDANPGVLAQRFQCDDAVRID